MRRISRVVKVAAESTRKPVAETPPRVQRKALTGEELLKSKKVDLT